MSAAKLARAAGLLVAILLATPAGAVSPLDVNGHFLIAEAKAGPSGAAAAEVPVIQRSCDISLFDPRAESYQGQVGYANCLVLGRWADGAAYFRWMSSRRAGMTNTQMLTAMLRSGEFRQKYGIARRTNADFVALIYRILLNRAPDRGDLEDFAAQLDQGTLSREDFLKSVIGSHEFRLRHPVLFRPEGETALSQRSCDLSRFDQQDTAHENVAAYGYCLVMGRTADQNDISGWVSSRRAGMSGTDMVAAMVGSQEFAQQYGTAMLNNDDFVTLIYNILLGRSPDGRGLPNYTALLDRRSMSRDAFARATIASNEFRGMHPILFLVTERRLAVRRECDLGGFNEQNTDYENQVAYGFCLIIGRDPGASALSTWTTLRRRGMDIAQMLSSMAGSDEFNAKYETAKLSNREYIVLIYRILLGRDPGGRRFASDAAQLNSGTLSRRDIVRSVVASDEFRSRNPLLFRAEAMPW